MADHVTIITCTGFRPEAFELCKQYIRRQTYQGKIQWIVVDDSKQIEPGKDYDLCRGPVMWQEGINTQRFNMEAALHHVTGDKLLIMEDDEYYDISYVERMVKLLDFADIVGEGNAKYYHLQVPGFKEMRNFAHASLCQTGIKSKLLTNLKAAVNSGEMYYDIHLWNQVHQKRISCVLLQDLNMCIGIKGMPGRGGLGVGHKTKDYLLDPNLAKLKEWLGADADNYLPFVRKKENDGRNLHRPPERAKRVLQSSATRLQPKETGEQQPRVESSVKPPEPAKGQRVAAATPANRYTSGAGQSLFGTRGGPTGSK